MKFDQFAKTMHEIQYRYGLDEIDIALIYQTKRLSDSKDYPNVMTLVNFNNREGKTTAHKRVKDLIKRGFLKVMYVQDGRLKLVELGPFALEMLESLWDEKEYIH